MGFRQIWQIALADYRERTRRSSFLILLAVAAVIAYACIPPASAAYTTMDVGGHRGIYNSAWVGTLVAAVTANLLALFGFFLVKDSVQRDEQTGVGQILATTPMGRSSYMLGKLLSNLAYLTSALGVLFVATAGMQMLRAEAPLELWSLAKPFLLLALPAMAFVSGLAVFFESVRWLRGGWGNILFCIGWIALLSVAASGVNLLDPAGITMLMKYLGEATKQAFPDYGGGLVLIGSRTGPEGGTFVWNGIPWTTALIGARLLWVAVAGSLALVAGLWFHRFDPSRQGGRPSGEAPSRNVVESAVLAERVALRPLTDVRRGGTFGAVLLAELRLLLHGASLWWWAGVLGLIIGGLSAPARQGQLWLLPLAWCWPLFLWSGMGSREARYRTEGLVFAAPRPVQVQLPGAWLAGVAVAMLLGAGVGLRFLMAGDVAALAGWVTGALFIPALALALGVWTGGSKAFEVTFALWFYVGVLNQVPVLDFIGSTGQSPTPVYLAMTAGLLALAWAGRQRQLRLL